MASNPVSRPFRFSCQLPALLADTSHLAADAFGALIRLRMAYWRNGPISDDNKVLARIVGMQAREWSKTRLELEPLFEISGETWTCWITQRDLEDAYKAIAANRQRTEKARIARLEKRLAARHSDCDSISNSFCDRGFDNISNNVCSKVLIGSIQSDHPKKAEKPRLNPTLAKDESVVLDGDLDVLVTAVEAELVGGDYGI